MISYGGVHITQDFGAPSLRDIAVQTMRLARFCGSSAEFWPVGMHLLLVADIGRIDNPELEHHFLLHDAAEACVNDVPRPMKTAAAKLLEGRVTDRIYFNLGLAVPTKAEREIIHAADMRAVNVEGRTVCGPRGYAETQPGIDYTDHPAMFRLQHYLRGFNPMDCLNANGKWPLELERRTRIAVTAAQKKLNFTKQYTKAA